MKKRKILLTVFIFICICLFTSISVNAMTREQAVNWTKIQANNGIMYKDSGNGGQCTDFVSAYMNYIVYGDAHYWKNSGGKGFRTYNAKEYFSKTYPVGWQKISNTPDFVPQPGDILCFGAGPSNSFGHVAVAIEGCTVSSMKGVGQNGLANNYAGTPAQYQTMSYYGSWGNFQGVIRPKWDNPEPQPVNLGDNFYAVILHKNSWKPISYDDDGYVRLRTETGTANQVWRFVRQSDGAYVIASTKNNKLLELTAGDTTDGKPVSVGGEDWGGNYQRWYLYEYGGGYIIKSKHYPNLNRVLDLSGGYTADGTSITTVGRNNTAAQIWAIYRGDEIKMKSPHLEVKTENAVTSFSWSDIYGELSYFLHIYKDGVLYKETVIPYGKGCSYSEALLDGNYRVYVAAHNAFYAKDSNTVNFAILDGKIAPSTWIKADKNAYCIGENITLHFGYKHTTSVSLGIDKDGKRYANPEVTGKYTYTYSLTEPGRYSVYVSGWSQNGYEDSKTITFTVFDGSMPISMKNDVDIHDDYYGVNTAIENLFRPAVYSVVSYDSSGRLLDMKNKDIPAGTADVSFTLPRHRNAAYVKVFLWDSLAGMQPLCDSETVSVK